MATGYSTQATTVLDGGNQMGDGAQVNAHRKANMVTISGAALLAAAIGAVGDTIVVFDYPGFCIPGALTFQSDTAMTGVTLNFGIAGNPTKYGTLTAPAANTRYTMDNLAVRLAGQLTAPDRLIVTVAGAALPTSAWNWAIDMSYVVPAC